jgi:hypothetical protein
MLVERLGQPSQRLRRDVAGNRGAHHAPADEALELGRIAFVVGRAGAVGEAVPEREDYGVAREARQFGALAACRESNGQQ